MVNNALIQGAAKTGKQFLDVGAAAAKGLSGYNSGSATPANDRAAKNKAIQSNVNNYMSNLKTDMDFTSFSPEETRTMRNFLISQRTEYANAAKEAAKLGDTSSPEYMQYVDIMQNVNNSFKNMASQIGAYKKGKVDYAENQLNGMYSNGNGDANKNAAVIYGFADVDNDGKKDPGMNAPFKILPGGNLGFDLNGMEVSYNDMEQPFFKDSKLALGILKDNETIYNKGQQGGDLNPEMIKSYKANLEAQLQNRNALKSIIFDFESELNTKSVADRINAGTLDWDDARNEVVNLLVKARQDVFSAGKKQYNIKQNTPTKRTLAQDLMLRESNRKKDSLLGGKITQGKGQKGNVFMKKLGDKFFITDKEGKIQSGSSSGYTQKEAFDELGLDAVGFSYE